MVKETLVFLLFFAMVVSTANAADYKKGNVYHGFKLIEKKFVKEVNAECLYFEHVKSGGKLFKIAADDDNKTFSIAFKTDPESDCGTPHIMEHSVLNGSKNFPVKSPFDILQKGSLNTFINAFTGSDLTCFPVASMNEKDYFNLMHIYLDAVFNPLFRTDGRVLKQEGWHYELENVDADVVYKGVVYNEMKGAYSNPERELGYQINKILFPDNGYRFSSGGYPTAIPKLTQEMFNAFHDKYYHPANGHILLYGNGNLDKELEFIDKEYFSNYERREAPKSFPIQKPFTELKEGTGYYPVTEGTNTENQTYLTLSIVAGLNTDRAVTMALNILTDVLVNQEAAPIRLALQEAGIGQDVEATVDELHQNVFQIVVQNANPGDKEKFKQIVFEKLNEVVKNGLDKKIVEGAINRTEFSLREGNDAQKGLTYNFQILPGWFFASDPYLTLEYEKPLSVVKSALTTNYLELIVDRYLIKNKHALIFVMEPKPGLDKENIANMNKELSNYKTNLTQEQKQELVKSTSALIAYQQQEDSPEALKTMPLLELKDINPKSTYFKAQVKEVNNVKILAYPDFTNNVVYTRLMFDLKALPVDLIPYSSLLTSVLGSQNTTNYTYGDLDNELNIHTGGFSSFLTYYLPDQNADNIKAMLCMDMKAMNNKTEKAFDLLKEIINNTKIEDVDRLKEILVRLQSRLEGQIKSNGYGFAQIRTSSYFSNAGKFDELTRGIEYYRFVSKLLKDFDNNKADIINKLKQTASFILNKNNMTVSVTAGKEDMPNYFKGLGNFTNAINSQKLNDVKWVFSFDTKNEGFMSPSKVQYVIKGFNFKKLGYNWSGKISVLNQIVSTDWLQTRVRVMGGAYGGFSNFMQSGQVFFNSYRDPNLKETLDNYAGIPEYLDKLEVTDTDMTRYIIGTIADLDVPLTSQQKGNRAVRYYFENTTPEMVQKDRDDILNTKISDIKSYKKMIQDILNKNNFCVYGSEQKIMDVKELFDKVENVIQ